MPGLTPIAEAQAPEIKATSKKADGDTAVLSIINHHVVLNSGITLLNPYNLTTNGIIGDPTNRRKLANGDGTKAKFFIDVAVNYVWAWDSDRRARFAAEELKEVNPDGKDGSYFFLSNFPNSLKAPLDIQGHLSYYAKDGKETTASAIVGSGSFGGEVTLGLPFYRALYTLDATVPQKISKEDHDTLYKKTVSAHWVGLTLSYSGVTDSDAFDIHSRFLLGVGYRAAFKTPFEVTDGSRNREVTVSFTVGAASVETVKFLSEATREIQLHHEDVPKYRSRPAFALEMEAYYPITASLSAVMGARLYSGTDPGTWNAYFGLTVPLSKIADILK